MKSCKILLILNFMIWWLLENDNINNKFYGIGFLYKLIRIGGDYVE